ncbi:NAD-dependent epimerase/dehydratase family protein [Nocardioides glacieisoli]|uniref:NAD-dependent epimerase/dehydratase family protein n=1 Tax=Nocardioides glacieisoli TaxID=1168730 RepID=A0A4V1RK87_9ACTN|nr:NAD-dependent epimerase/dehydratase family protein [Nocardioides glacieisoli]RYB91422.1 NAD-dependent epimerase/dehydratase family protein [Nocardioides glacieisoli]
MNTVHVVTGAGPVGSTVALQLADAGHQVRLLTRSGSGPVHPLIDRRRVDVSRTEVLAETFDGAVAVHHCIHGSAYDARVWRAELPQAEAAVLAAAGRVGAVVVFPESLYSYGQVDGPLTEDLPRTATTGKLGVRTELLAQREASATPTVSVAASDFYGPVVRNAHAGERLVPTVLAGRTMRVLGSLDQPHSFTYVPDLAAAMIEAAARPELWNSFLHAPTAAPVTQRRLVELVAEAGGVPVPRMSALPPWVLRASGVVSREMRELAETAYMFTAPFVLDSSASEQRLGLAPTSLTAGLAATVEWWRAQDSAAA